MNNKLPFNTIPITRIPASEAFKINPFYEVLPENKVKELFDHHHIDIRFGTITALIEYNDDQNILVFVANNKKGNGHFSLFMDYIEQEAKDASKPLVIAELWNHDLKKHLLTVRGYKKRKQHHNDVIKYPK